MDLEFEIGPLHVKARYSPAVPGRRVGHPDRWTEHEPAEIEILSVEGEADCEVTDEDLEDAARVAASSKVADRMDAYIARQEE